MRQVPILARRSVIKSFANSEPETPTPKSRGGVWGGWGVSYTNRKGRARSRDPILNTGVECHSEISPIAPKHAFLNLPLPGEDATHPILSKKIILLI